MCYNVLNIFSTVDVKGQAMKNDTSSSIKVLIVMKKYSKILIFKINYLLLVSNKN